MNLGQLIDQIKYYFEDASDLSDAVIVRAINASRKAAETQFAFEMNKMVLQASVDARTGASWISLPALGTSSPVLPVRSLKRAYTIASDGIGLNEIKFDYRGLLKYNASAPMSSVVLGTSLDERVFIIGPTIYVYPFGTQGTLRSLAFDGYRWMDEYFSTDLAVEDWMLTHHYMYLFWQSVWDLNYKKKEWVPRQEGNLQVSKDQADGEFRKMIIWDSSIRSYQTSLNELM
jgi:hypothetical protein